MFHVSNSKSIRRLSVVSVCLPFDRSLPLFFHLPVASERLAYLRFTSKLDELVPFRRWLRVEPAFALLTPGERAEFRVSVFVDRLTARVRANPAPRRHRF